MDLLVCLAGRPGEVLSKDELLEEVWEGAFVTESNLTRAVAELRHALGDDASNPRYIETIAKRGYRLVAAVAPVDPGGATGGRPVPGAETKPGSLPWALPVLGILVPLLLVAGWWAIHRGDREAERRAQPVPAVAPAPDLRLRQLTTSPGLEAFPALSPDGVTVAYASDESGSFELYVLPITPGSRPLQLTADGENNVQPAWSPDRRYLAYHSMGRGGVWVMPALGGEPRQLSPFGSDPDWSPDGRRLVFQSDDLTEISRDAFSAMPPSTLWTVSFRGGSPRPLTRKGEPPGGHGAPAWSPDGGSIVFTSHGGGPPALWRITADGRQLMEVTKQGRPLDPVWHPEGYEILCYRTRRAENEIWRLPDPGSSDASLEPTRVLRIEGRYLTLDREGRRLVTSRLENRSELWTIPMDPGRWEAVGPAVPLLRDTSLRNSQPSFSPDGERILLGIARRGQPTELWLMTADGSRRSPLVEDRGESISGPVWLRAGTPPGRWVSYNAARWQGSRLLREVRRIDVETRREEVLAPLGLDWIWVRAAPEGRRIAFHRFDDRVTNVWVQNLGSPGDLPDEPVQVTFDESYAGFPTWSPDGRWLAVEIKSLADTQVAVVPAAGGETVQLTAGRGQRFVGGWSPDGRRIVYAGLEGGRWNLWWVPFGGGPVHRITDFRDTPSTFVRYPAWSPTGDRIVFEHRVTTGDLWLMELE
jgi:Tol biopolymer transport system component